MALGPAGETRELPEPYAWDGPVEQDLRRLDDAIEKTLRAQASRAVRTMVSEQISMRALRAVSISQLCVVALGVLCTELISNAFFELETSAIKAGHNYVGHNYVGHHYTGP